MTEEIKTAREVELENNIETQDFIMSRCTDDESYRIYQARINEWQRELREIRRTRRAQVVAPPAAPPPAAEDPVTRQEQRVLGFLVQACNEFMQLSNHGPDDLAEFRHAVHAAQRVIATRLARRTAPDTWWSPPPQV
jgi:hypothetical protein